MIYLDNAATTKMYRECIPVFEKYACDCYFNPSALYSQAVEPSNVEKQTKMNIAKHIGCKYDELYFTASGSEGDNFALLCTIKPKKGKVLTSNIEHAAVYNTAYHLKELGYDVEYIPVDSNGCVVMSEFIKMMTTDVVLVSIMHVCNETGACNSIKDLVGIAKRVNPNVVFHSDGVQAFGKIPVNVYGLGVDVYTMSSHKISGPKGVGIIYIKSNVHPRTFIYGGGQESNLRSATENVPGIAALNVAIDLSFNNIVEKQAKARILQKHIIDYISNNISDCIINTNMEQSSPYIVSFSVKNIRGEGVVHYLESRDIVIGTGSACSAKKGLKRIPTALGLDPSYFDGMLRISYESDFNIEDIDIALKEIKSAIIIERNLRG